MDTKVIAGALARHLLGIAGTWLVSRGLLDQSAIEPTIGAVLTIGAVAWSIWQKQRAAKP